MYFGMTSINSLVWLVDHRWKVIGAVMDVLSKHKVARSWQEKRR